MELKAAAWKEMIEREVAESWDSGSWNLAGPAYGVIGDERHINVRVGDFEELWELCYAGRRIGSGSRWFENLFMAAAYLRDA